MYRPWDVSGIVNRPSGINFAFGISRNGHTNNGKLIFQQISLNLIIFIIFCFLLLLWHALACSGMLWHALACFVMLCHALSSIVIQGERPQGTKERDPRAQRNGTPGHKGPINREAGGPTGTGGSQFGMPYWAHFYHNFTKNPAKFIQNLYKRFFSYVQQTLGCVGNYKQTLWDQFRIRNFPEWSHKQRETHISAMFPKFYKMLLSFASLACFGMLWHALVCFGMLWHVMLGHAWSCFVIHCHPRRDPRTQRRETPQGTKEWDPRALRPNQ